MSSQSHRPDLPGWIIEPRPSVLAFAGRRLGAPWVEGMFTQLFGRLELQPDDPGGGRCELFIKVRRLVAGTPELNTHLRVFDLLDAQEHPILPIVVDIGDPLPEGHRRAQATLDIAGTPISTHFELVLETSGAGACEGPSALPDQVTLRAQGKIEPFRANGSPGGTIECELDVSLHVVAMREDLSASSADSQPRARDDRAGAGPERRWRAAARLSSSR